MNHTTLPLELPPRPARGIALVVTLLLLVLLSAFAVAFFTRMSVEQVSSASYSDGVTSRQLAESAVGVVMGQIRDATTVPNGCWASQPGMVRVFATGLPPNTKASSEPFGYYKLYSSNNMTLTGGDIKNFDPANEVNVDPATEPALWTDINEPVSVQYTNQTGQTQTIQRYPIIDASTSSSGSPLFAASSDMTDPQKLSYHNSQGHVIEGFSIDKSKNGRLDASMPVRWLYVLRDGTLTAPDGSKDNGKTAEWKSATGRAQPTKDNPIVGRVAFWTDDDTSKVNINTSGGFTLKGIAPYDYKSYAGSYWDTPRFMTKFDYGGYLDPAANKGKFLPGEGSLSLCQPPSNEFQRYPGHPFTTSLGLVFSSPNPGVQPRLTSEQLYRILPRFATGGSKGGTERLLTVAANANDSDERLAPKNQRLFASVDEFFYAADANSSPANNNNKRQTTNELLKTGLTNTTYPQYNIPAMTDDLVEKDGGTYRLDGYRFFLTAHSRAPELNLFGRPRVSIWPEWAAANQGAPQDYSYRRNSTEKLIAFCSTLGPEPQNTAKTSGHKEFYFQRYDPYSPTNDFNLKRNGELLKTYLTNPAKRNGVTDLVPPGFDTSFLQKYKDDRDQILTEIFDYIRVANLRDTSYYRSLKSGTLGSGAIDTSKASEVAKMEEYMYAPRGVVVPIKTTGLGSGKSNAGFGRFSTVSEVSLVFYHAGYISTQGDVYFDPREKQAKGVKENLIRAFLIVECYNPMQGYAGLSSFSDTESRLQGKGLKHKLRLQGAPTIMVQSVGAKGAITAQPVSFLNFSDSENKVRYASGSFWGGANIAGMEGFQHTMGKKMTEVTNANWAAGQGRPGSAVDLTYAAITPPGSEGIYPFQWGDVVRVPGDLKRFNQTTFDFNGGSPGQPFEALLTVSFSGLDLQTIKLSFPAATFPVPTDAYWYEQGGLVWDNPVLPVVPTYTGGKGFPGWGGAAFGRPEWAKSVAARLYWMLGSPANTGSSGGVDTYNTANAPINVGNPARGFNFAGRWRQILQPGDVVRSLVPPPPDPTNPESSATDPRTIALAQASVGAAVTFKEMDDYKTTYIPGTNPPEPLRHVQSTLVAKQKQTQTLRAGGGAVYMTGTAMEPDDKLINGQVVAGWKKLVYNIATGNLVNFADKSRPYSSKAADLPASVNGVKLGNGKPGDFDTGVGDLPDGAFCNKADEGNMIYRRASNISSDGYIYDHPYYTSPSTGGGYGEVFDTFFSPNRQLPSPVLFGSLLAGRGGDSNKTDWRTLCFSPNPASLSANTPVGKADHPGFDVASAGDFRDHLILDLFTMPMVEPYAISEPFSTAGKVNLNCELMPFSYIHRTTALRAALQALRVTAVTPDVDKSVNPPQLIYKRYESSSPKTLGTSSSYSIYSGQNQNYRYVLNRDETIKSITSVFRDTSDARTGPVGGFYRSASQICERFLYPQTDGKPPKWSKAESDIHAFWAVNTLGGDNTREKPYADLYPRVTTKSNTFTVHVRVQKLRPQKGPNFAQWTETGDSIAAEYRGETQIERYLDPQDRRFDSQNPDTQKNGDFIDVDAQSLEPTYRFRVIHSKRFTPDR